MLYQPRETYVPDFKMKICLSITQALCASLRKFENEMKLKVDTHGTSRTGVGIWPGCCCGEFSCSHHVLPPVS